MKTFLGSLHLDCCGHFHFRSFLQFWWLHWGQCCFKSGVVHQCKIFAIPLICRTRDAKSFRMSRQTGCFTVYRARGLWTRTQKTSQEKDKDISETPHEVHDVEEHLHCSYKTWKGDFGSLMAKQMLLDTWYLNVDHQSHLTKGFGTPLHWYLQFCWMSVCAFTSQVLTAAAGWQLRATLLDLNHPWSVNPDDRALAISKSCRSIQGSK